MLRRINISNYILIESLDLQFPEGLIIVTGETGAGKSILLGAISLLLGAKADVSMLGDKSRSCVVEAEFEIEPNPELLQVFDEAEMEFDRNIVLRRVISPSGRSRSFLNDEPVNVQFLASISSGMIDIHSQHQHLRLADEKFRLSVIDAYASDKELLSEYSASYRRMTALASEIKELEGEIALADRDREFRQFQYDELEKARLVQGESEALEAEQKELSHAEEIKELLSSASARFSIEDYSFVQGMKESIRDISKVALQIPRFTGLAERLESCRIELQDIEDELERESESVKVSPQRLAEVEERLSLLWGLMKKHGCSTVEELISKRDSLGGTLSGYETSASRLASLKAEFEETASRTESLASALHDVRARAADELAPVMQQAIRSLEMPFAVFKVEVSLKDELRQDGRDAVRFLFCSGPEMVPDDVHNTASGGELSRIMLCVKSLLARYKDMATLVFDEIDTGVSGSVADKIGTLLGEMGKNMQVVAITHLPQVAAKGNTHFCVRKTVGGSSKAVTTVEALSGMERVNEIARLLSGATVTQAAVRNAEELLRSSQNAEPSTNFTV